MKMAENGGSNERGLVSQINLRDARLVVGLKVLLYEKASTSCPTERTPVSSQVGSRH